MFVFDASTLILTAKIELLDLFLNEIGIEVAIPKAVEAECCSRKKTLDALMIEKAVNDSRIKVRSVRNKKLVAKLEEDFSIARGESEAIALALQEKASLLGIDDRQGINACKLVGVPFTTAIGILVRSWDRGLLEHGTALIKFAELSKYGRYKNAILEEATRKMEERR